MSVFTRRDKCTPLLIMLQGLPGSGKSTFAQNIKTSDGENEFEPVIHSSDSLRKELFGNEETQGDNNMLFTELHKRIKYDLSIGKDVVFDATNIKKKNRIQFLKEMSKIKCTPICVCIMTTVETCVKNNHSRDRKVPDEVIRRMYLNWQPPHYNEGFEEIRLMMYPLTNSEQEKYTIHNFFETANSFDQENKHHKLSLGEHCTKAATFIQNDEKTCDNYPLLFAAMIHDNGKLTTKTRINAKGIEDGDCHYYQHHCAGSYDSFFYMKNSPSEFEKDDMIYIMNLIFYHMCPYLEWKQSERVLNRDKKLLGDKMFNNVMSLHEADLFAH